MTSFPSDNMYDPFFFRENRGVIFYIKVRINNHGIFTLQISGGICLLNKNSTLSGPCTALRRGSIVYFISKVHSLFVIVLLHLCKDRSVHCPHKLADLYFRKPMVSWDYVSILCVQCNEREVYSHKTQWPKSISLTRLRSVSVIIWPIFHSQYENFVSSLKMLAQFFGKMMKSYNYEIIVLSNFSNVTLCHVHCILIYIKPWIQSMSFFSGFHWCTPCNCSVSWLPAHVN